MRGPPQCWQAPNAAGWHDVCTKKEGMKRVTARAAAIKRSRQRILTRRRSLTHAHAHAQRSHRRLVHSIWNDQHRPGRGSTLLALVQEVQRRVENDADVVRVVRWMVNTGAVVLTGTFAGRTI